MKRQIKLSEEAQQLAAGQQTQQQAVSEFATPEALLRHDAEHTPVPPRIEYRLAESIGQVPAPPQPWWRRLFGT